MFIAIEFDALGVYYVPIYRH